MLEREIPVGRSWDDQIKSLAKHWSDELEAQLIELYEELRLYGRKHIFLHKRATGLAKLVDALKGLSPSAAAGKQFPFPPKDGDGVVGGTPKLVAVREYDEKLLFVFFSMRRLRHEIPFNHAWLKQDTPEHVRNSEILVTEEVREAAFDVVAVPMKKGLIEVRVDHFNAVTEPRPDVALKNVLKAFAKLTTDAGITEEILGNPVNVAPAIAALYAAKKEGNVVQLKFMCSTQAKRSETMMAHKGQDLRVEAYHKHGVKALGTPIQIYSIALEWFFDGDDEPLDNAHLLLPGTKSMIGDNARPLYEVRVPKLTGRLEHDFMLKRLSEYVP